MNKKLLHTCKTKSSQNIRKYSNQGSDAQIPLVQNQRVNSISSMSNENNIINPTLRLRNHDFKFFTNIRNKYNEHKIDLIYDNIDDIIQFQSNTKKDILNIYNNINDYFLSKGIQLSNNSIIVNEENRVNMNSSPTFNFNNTLENNKNQANQPINLIKASKFNNIKLGYN